MNIVMNLAVLSAKKKKNIGEQFNMNDDNMEWFYKV